MARASQATACRGGIVSWRGLPALAVCILLGACAQSPKPSLPQMLSQQSENETPPPTTTDAGKSELAKATKYWGQEYAKDPRGLPAALSYAKDLKAMGEKRRALAVLQQASILHGDSRELASEYGRLALEFDQIGLAGRLLAAADDPTDPDWRIISARGTVLAKQGKYKDAIPYYEHALELSHDQPSVLSNLALAHAMDGEPKRAEAMLRKAAAADRNSLKIRQNLALVLGLQGKYDEAKLLASRDLSAESAEENTDYLRRVVKLAAKKPPVSEPTASVARASKPANKKPAREMPVAEDDSDQPEEAKPEAAQTSDGGAKEQRVMMMAQAGGILRGALPFEKAKAKVKAKAEVKKKPQTTPDFDTTFSVAQWLPQTTPAPIEPTAHKPSTPKSISHPAHGE